MPANQININLLPRNNFGNNPFGRLLTWSMTYGRYLMVLTELVVLVAFVSRFSLDRKLTDLKEEIAQKQEILEVNRDLEAEIRRLQNQLAQVRNLLKNQNVPLESFLFLQTILPNDVVLRSVNSNQEKIFVTAVAGTTESFAKFLNNLTNNKRVARVEVTKVEKQPLKNIEFQFNAFLTKL